MDDFVEKTDEGFAKQLKDHAEGLDTYGATLGFTTGETDAAKDDAKLFNYLMERQSVNQKFAQDFTDYKRLARKGDGTIVLPLTIPQPAAYPTPLPSVTAAGIEGRFRQRAAKAKAHTSYTHGMGVTLRIEKTHTPFDPNSGSPNFTVDMNHAGHPHIKFNKGKWQGAEIWKLVIKNSGTTPPPTPGPSDPGFQKLERVFGHDYIDPTELPASGNSEIWAYKLIHIFNNQQVGSWSSVKFVTVGGV